MKYTLESFSECTDVSNVLEVGRKSVPGGWATVGETSFSKSSSCCWQANIRTDMKNRRLRYRESSEWI